MPNWKNRIDTGALDQRRLIFVSVIFFALIFGVGTAQGSAPEAAGSQKDTPGSQSRDDGGIDFTLWAQKRIQAYKESLLLKKDVPIGVLHIGKLALDVLVFEGTDDLTLNRGAGRIAGTAMPGEAGNIGIAGHRDGFFRGLKDISVGDTIELTTPKQKMTYTVEQIEIVSPSDVHVLLPRATPSLTIVTCYPFYFVGDAPQRYIVHAALAKTESNLPSSAKDESK